MGTWVRSETRGTVGQVQFPSLGMSTYPSWEGLPIGSLTHPPAPPHSEPEAPPCLTERGGRQ